MLRPIPLCIALCCLTLAAVPLAAQTPPAATGFEEEVTVREILVDVLVTDGDGQLIVGLDEDDFQVTVDGEAAPVAGVAFYSNRRFLGELAPAESEAPRAGTAAPPDDRHFVLLYQRRPMDQGMDGSERLRLRQAARSTFEWMMEELLPNDYLAVVSFDGELRVQQDFTLDRRLLGQAVERASGGGIRGKRWPSRTAPSLPGLSLEQALADTEPVEGRDEPALAALEQLATALASLPGRKVLVLFAGDFPRLDPGSARRGAPPPPLVGALHEANIAVYPVDLLRRGRQPSLQRLATETGGEYAFAFVDFLDPLRHIGRLNSGYYLLSVRAPAAGSDGEYRSLEVRVTHPEFRVAARSGYFAQE